jgi:CheY-like chemotaxis protein
MRVLIVEDDYLQAQWLADKIAEQFSHVNISFISTEFELRKRFGSLRTEPPDIILLDVMLRWTDPSPEMEPAPPEVREGGYFRAGLRCEQLISQAFETQEIPVILYTVLEEKDLTQLEITTLGARTYYLAKNSDPEELLSLIKKITHAPKHSPS